MEIKINKYQAQTIAFAAQDSPIKEEITSILQSCTSTSGQQALADTSRLPNYGNRRFLQRAARLNPTRNKAVDMVMAEKLLGISDEQLAKEANWSTLHRFLNRASHLLSGDGFHTDGEQGLELAGRFMKENQRNSSALHSKLGKWYGKRAENSPTLKQNSVRHYRTAAQQGGQEALRSFEKVQTTELELVATQPKPTETEASPQGSRHSSNFLQRAGRSPLAKMITTIVLAAMATAVTGIVLLPVALALASVALLSVAGMALHNVHTRGAHQITYEMTLAAVVLSNATIGKVINYPHHSQILPNLILGAVPLYNLDHQAEFRDRNLSVLSMLEPFEYSPTLFSDPITPDDWKREPQCHFNQIPTADYDRISDEKLEEAVEYVHSEHLAGRQVYVHCKAGVGRSATVVIAYLMKHQGMSFNQAYKHVRQQRWLAITPPQKEQLLEYEAKLQEAA